MIAGSWQTVRRELFERGERGFPTLDGIRAVAVLAILAFHTGSFVAVLAGEIAPMGLLQSFLREMWLGVDIFFVLSGFLIGRILLVQLRDGPVDYAGFYVRRATRIFPAYYLVLTVAVFVLSPLSPFVLVYQNLPLSDVMLGSLKSYSYLANYLRHTKAPDVMGWTWSLCVEEHFYLVLPITLALIWRAHPRVRLGALIVLSLVPMAVRFMAFHENRTIRLWTRMQWESHTHCDGLLLGVVLAYLFVYHHEWLTRVAQRRTKAMLFVAFLCFACVFWRGGLFRAAPFAVVAQLFVIPFGTALVVATCLLADHPLARLLAHPSWYPIARVSYGMYLIHPFVILWLLSLQPELPHRLLYSTWQFAIFGGVVVASTFAIASVLFLAVELPALRWGQRRTRDEPPSRRVAYRAQNSV